MNIDSNGELLLINAFDEKLPKFTTRIADPAFVKTIMEFQIDPILINVRDGSWRVVCGNRRLSAVRQAREIGGKGLIKATFVHNMTDEWEHKILIIENAARSANKPSQYKALKELLATYQDFKTVATLLHLTVPEVKKMDSEWKGVPSWVEKGCINGDISLTVAIEIGKSPDIIKERAKKTFELEGAITGADLKLFSQVQKAVVSEATIDAFKGFDFGVAKKTFVSVEDINRVIGETKHDIELGDDEGMILLRVITKLEELVK